MKHFKQWVAGLALVLATGTATAADIIVSAAASLTNAFTEVARAFEQTNSGHKVLLNFAGSGALLQQIARGAPVDVFASADQDTMDRALKQNLIVRSSRVDFARNTLVVVVPLAGGSAISDLAGVKDVTRVAISNTETVPVGKYTKAALEAAGLWDAVKGKSVNTQNVRQSLDYVARGEVDAGFIYATDAAIMPDKVKVQFEVPTATPISYPIAVVKGNGKEALAQRFVDFVRSDVAQAILVKHGFSMP